MSGLVAVARRGVAIEAVVPVRMANKQIKSALPANGRRRHRAALAAACERNRLADQRLRTASQCAIQEFEHRPERRTRLEDAPA